MRILQLRKGAPSLMLSLFLLLGIASQNQISAQTETPYSIELRSRVFTPPNGIPEPLKNNLTQAVQNGQKRHVIIQFKENPSAQVRHMLRGAGVQLQNTLGNNAWIAVLEQEDVLDFENLLLYRRRPYLSTIRSISAIQATDKSSEAISSGTIGSHARPQTGRIQIIVQFYSDVSEEEAQVVLGNYGQQIEGPGMINDYLIEIDESSLNTLLEEEFVQYIDQKSPPETTNNDCSRVGANVNAVQGGVYNLDGTNVQIGVWDGGAIFNHADFGTRLTVSEAVGINDHATHVAGTMAGDGSSSVANGGATNQWRGVATNAGIFSLTFLGGDLEPEEHDDEINNNGIDLSQNSWGLILGVNAPLHGDYILRAAKYDNITTGIYGQPIPVIFSAGNNQQRIQNAFGAVTGFGSITPPGGTGKNVLTVGAINCDDNSMTTFSSWGPTDDGRLKPDVVAPGGETGANGVVSTIPQNNDDDGINNTTGAFISDGLDDFFFPYSNSAAGAGEPEPVGTGAAPQGIWEGTSMAAPVASGVVALMLQEYRQQYYTSDASNEAPLPATFKAILAHTGTDLGNPGPDYQFGYGLINAQAAVDVIRDDRALQNVIGMGEEQIYSFTVPAGQASLRVTVAWDDPAAAALAASTLVNDMDLTLESPTGTIFSPWTLNPAAPNANATTGTDNINNLEQVFVNLPAAGTWRIHINGTNLNQPAADPRQTYALVSDFNFVQEQDVSVTQVIDRTGSMGTYGYMGPAIIASQNFIELMKIGDEVGVVHFDDENCDNVGSKANSAFNLTSITSAATQTNASSAANTTSRGCTSIGGGIQQALSGIQLGIADANHPQAMVVLTDGFENRDPLTATILPTVPEEVDIYTIALGETADEELMQNIATSTGGQFYASPSVLNLLGIYYQIQGDIEGSDMASIATGNKEGGNDTYIIPIEEGLEQISFVLGWLQQQAQLELRVVNPNNETVATGTSGTGITPIAYHKFIRPQAGNWRVHITRTDTTGGPAEYTFAALVNGGTKLYSFVPTLTEAGSCLNTEVELFHVDNFQPITGATVKAYFSAPAISKYTFNHNLIQQEEYTEKPWFSRFPELFKHYANGKYRQPIKRANEKQSTASTTEKITSSVDPISSWATNIRNASERLTYDEWEVLLFDDGTHGDASAGDGIYTHCVDRSQISGSYNVRFEISGTGSNGQNFVRERLATAYVAPSEVDADRGIVEIYPPKIQSIGEGNEGVITIIPTDRFGNLLGPGLSDNIQIETNVGSLIGSIEDNKDGYYFQRIRSNGTTGRGNINVSVEGVPLQNTPPLIFKNFLKGPVISLHAGLTNPVDSLSMRFKQGLYAGLDFGYRFSPSLALVGYVGLNNFRAINALEGDDFRLVNFSINAKYRRNISGLWYASGQAGLGIYVPSEGDTELGYNAGINLDYAWTSSLSVEIGTDFHYAGEHQRFFQNRIGLLYNF